MTEVIARYVDATYRGDVATLRGCFHPTAVMCGYLGDEVLAGGPERFFEDIGATPTMESTGAAYVAETALVEVAGDAAGVRLEETGFFGALLFVNWFHLIRTEDGEWRIVSKLFAMRPPEAGTLDFRPPEAPPGDLEIVFGLEKTPWRARVCDDGHLERFDRWRAACRVREGRQLQRPCGRRTASSRPYWTRPCQDVISRYH